MKIVLNKCFGGFSLSGAAIHRYAELQGKTVHEEDDHGMTRYWTVPLDVVKENYPLDDDEISYSKWHDFCEEHSLNAYDFERSDPILVQIVEEMGKESGGDGSGLVVVDIPDDVDYYIDEYDGIETACEKHRRW